jgi:Putative beta-barrel porin 2
VLLGMRATSSGWGVFVSMILIMGTLSPSFAQYAAPGSQATSGSQGSAASGSQGTSSAGPEVSPTGEYKEGLALGGWMLAPEIFLGAVWNSNANQLANGENQGTSLRVSPRIVGYYDGGMYKTSVYGVLDGQFFNTNTIAATAGLTNTYQPWEDLLLASFFNYTRETSLFNSALNFNNNAIGPPGTPSAGIPIILNPFGTTPTVNPIAYNQFTGGGSINKKFNDGFASLGATAFYILYDSQSNLIQPPFQTSTNATSVWVQGRVGYHFLPGVYAFAEGDGIFERFQNSVFDTDGYRVSGGVGMDDPSSLLRGEIYGGFQAQFQSANNNIFGTSSIPLTTPNGIRTDVSSGVFGARLNYYPTEYSTWILQIDQTLGVTTALSPGVPQGTPSKVTTAILQTNYALSRDWWLGLRVGYTQGWFFSFAPETQGWLAGASFNYAIWRNLLLTLDYQYTNERSNAQFSSFTLNQVSAGLTYRY